MLGTTSAKQENKIVQLTSVSINVLTQNIIGTLRKLWLTLNMLQSFVLHRENLCVLISDFSEAWKTLVLHLRN